MDGVKMAGCCEIAKVVSGRKAGVIGFLNVDRGGTKFAMAEWIYITSLVQQVDPPWCFVKPTPATLLGASRPSLEYPATNPLPQC